MKSSNDNNRKATERNSTAAWDRSRQRLHAGAILFATCALVGAVPTRAQDVAEAARQEHVRKDKQSKRLKHVYTEEDLSRARILTPEDRQLLEAEKREQVVPVPEMPAADIDAQILEQLPLGDIARKFRSLKEASREQAPKSAEFHLPFEKPAWASPKPAFVVPKPRAVQPWTRRTPAAPIFPNATAPHSIIVKRGDSLWKLAKINLGDGQRWHELVAANPSIVNPHHIVAGTPIRITGSASPAHSDSNITVHKGDSLWKIAQVQLGHGGYWGCIAQANPTILDANRIYAGQILALPSSCGTQSSK